MILVMLYALTITVPICVVPICDVNCDVVGQKRCVEFSCMYGLAASGSDRVGRRYFVSLFGCIRHKQREGTKQKKHPFFRLLPHPPTMAQQLLAVRSRHNLWSAIAFIGPLREGVGILKQ